MKNLLLFCFLAYCLTSCTKSIYETSISGHVVENNGTRKIPFAKVYLVETVYTGSANDYYLDSLITNEEGYYHFDFNYGEGLYKIEGKAPYHYTNNEYRTLKPHIRVGELQTHNVELDPYAWLKIRFLNQSGADGVNVNRIYNNPYGYRIYGKLDTTVLATTLGNGINFINYFVYPDGTPNEKQVFCPGLDTTYAQIIY